MKQFLTYLLTTLLICSMLFLLACGSDGGDEAPTTDTDNVTTAPEPIEPMPDPSNGILAPLYGTDGLLAQPERSVFDLNTWISASVFECFATAEDIITRGRPETPLYGLYAFTHEYADNQDTVSRVGFTNARLTKENVRRKGHWYAGITDEHMHAICDSGISVMWTSGVSACNGTTTMYSFFFPEYLGAGRADTHLRDTSFDYYNLTGWLYENVNMALDLLANYGPRGSYFERYPNAEYNPIRYIEIFNEPNYHYNIPVKTETGYDDAYAAVKYEAYAILQVVVSAAIREAYGDEVKVVGMAAGGGAEAPGITFVCDTLALAGNDRLEAIMNAAVDPDALVRFDKECINIYENNTPTRCTESEDDFQIRKEYAAALRAWLGLEDNETLALDLVGSMDILSIHPYMDETSPFGGYRLSQTSQASAVAEMRRALNANVLDKTDTSAVKHARDLPFWFTECGWEIKGPKAYADYYPEDVANGIRGGYSAEYSTKRRGTSQIIQAAMEVQNYLFGIRNGIDRITLMHLYDTDNCNYGLVNYGYGKSTVGGGDKSWRLTLYAINTMISILPNPALVGVVAENTGTEDYDPFYCIYEIEADVGGEIVTTLFAPIMATDVMVPWEDAYALVTDMFGRSQIVRAHDGYLSLSAGPYLQYIRHVDEDAVRTQYELPREEVTPVALFSHAWYDKENSL